MKKVFGPPFVHAVVGGLVASFISLIGVLYGPSIADRLTFKPWEIPSALSNNAFVEWVRDGRIEVCYDEGDGAVVVIDHTNQNPPPTEGYDVNKYPRVQKGTCREIQIADTPNVGIFLEPGAQEAQGRYRIKVQ